MTAQSHDAPNGRLCCLVMAGTNPSIDHPHTELSRQRSRLAERARMACSVPADPHEPYRPPFDRICTVGVADGLSSRLSAHPERRFGRGRPPGSVPGGAPDRPTPVHAEPMVWRLERSDSERLYRSGAACSSPLSLSCRPRESRGAVRAARSTTASGKARPGSGRAWLSWCCRHRSEVQLRHARVVEEG